MWRLLAIGILGAGCKHSVERPPPPTAPPAPQIALADGGDSAPSTALYAVPPDVAAQVTLREVAGGFDRPVLVVSPPGAPRQFVVEQRGALRTNAHGKPSAKTFFA